MTGHSAGSREGYRDQCTIAMQSGGDGVRPGNRGVYLTCEKDFEKRASRELLEVMSRVSEPV